MDKAKESLLRTLTFEVLHMERKNLRSKIFNREKGSQRRGREDLLRSVRYDL